MNLTFTFPIAIGVTREVLSLLYDRDNNVFIYRFCTVGQDLSTVKKDRVKKGTETGLIQLLIVSICHLYEHYYTPASKKTGVYCFSSVLCL